MSYFINVIKMRYITQCLRNVLLFSIYMDFSAGQKGSHTYINLYNHVYDCVMCACLPSGVCQSMLETVVPKALNATVMIVGGKKHKGQVTCLHKCYAYCYTHLSVASVSKISMHLSNSAKYIPQLHII